MSPDVYTHNPFRQYRVSVRRKVRCYVLKSLDARFLIIGDSHCFGPSMLMTRFPSLSKHISTCLYTRRTSCIFCLKLGILPFKVIADLIGLYFIAFKNGADGSMGNTLQFRGIPLLRSRTECTAAACGMSTVPVPCPDPLALCMQCW